MTVHLELVDERLTRDAEDLGGACTVSFRLFEHAVNVLALDLGKSSRPRHENARTAQRRAAAELLGELRRKDHIAVFEEDHALDRMAQLPDVARPGVALEALQRLVGETQPRLDHLRPELFHEAVREEGDVSLALAEGR